MPPRPNARVLRDIKARQGVANNEISRRAYLYVARNHSLPAQVRYQAQLQLNAFGRYTRPTTVKNRCTATGRGRGVMGEFGLCRVSESVFFFYVPCADWVACGGSTVPISFESSRGGVARRSQSLLVEGIVRIGS
jgi:small subunit ribosomal protein S14